MLNRCNLLILVMVSSIASFGQTPTTQADRPWYTIVGDVERPGLYQLLSPMRVFDAITSAGGFHSWNPPNDDAVVVVRGDKEIAFDWAAFREGRNLQQNIFLNDQDHVIVKLKKNSK
jgi:protein involved in polysaccharide export with SLBB domain